MEVSDAAAVHVSRLSQNRYFLISEPSSFPLSPQSDPICQEVRSLSFLT
jgi:hypothetical protein